MLELKSRHLTYTLIILILLALSLIAYIIYVIIFSNICLSTLLAPIGIVLASFIASVSVMKSIKSNEELKKSEIKRLEKNQLLFINYILKEIRRRSSFQWGAKENKSWLCFSTLIVEIKELRELWKKLCEVEFFIFISEEGYEYFANISIELDMLNYHISKINIKNEEEVDNFIFDQLSKHNKVIKNNVDKLLIIINRKSS